MVLKRYNNCTQNYGGTLQNQNIKIRNTLHAIIKLN